MAPGNGWSDKFVDDNAAHWKTVPPGQADHEAGGDESDPETLLLAMLAVADHAESDEEAQAAIAHIAASLGGEEEQQAEPVEQKLLALRDRLQDRS